eukprot:1813365-Amphidinium_carterae.1
MAAQGILKGTGLSRLAEDERWKAAGVADLKLRLALGLAGNGADRQDSSTGASSTTYLTSAPERSNGTKRM